MADANRSAHSRLLESFDDIDQVVCTATNFKDYISLLNFVDDVYNEAIRYNPEWDAKCKSRVKIADLCSGCGIFGVALAARIGKPCEVYFVDIVGEFQGLAVKLLAQLTEDCVANTLECSADKIPVGGEIMDIVIESDGFHHCPSLDDVIQESSRILRSGGILLGLDRIHEDKTPQSKLDAILDYGYPQDWLQEQGFIDGKLTRRQNGEKELRLCEWLDALAQASFTKTVFIQYVYRKKASLVTFIKSTIDPIYKLESDWPIPPRWTTKILPALLLGIRYAVKGKNVLYVFKPFRSGLRLSLLRRQVIIAVKS